MRFNFILLIIFATINAEASWVNRCFSRLAEWRSGVQNLQLSDVQQRAREILVQKNETSKTAFDFLREVRNPLILPLIQAQKAGDTISLTVILRIQDTIENELQAGHVDAILKGLPQNQKMSLVEYVKVGGEINSSLVEFVLKNNSLQELIMNKSEQIKMTNNELAIFDQLPNRDFIRQLANRYSSGLVNTITRKIFVQESGNLENSEFVLSYTTIVYPDRVVLHIPLVRTWAGGGEFKSRSREFISLFPQLGLGVLYGAIKLRVFYNRPVTIMADSILNKKLELSLVKFGFRTIRSATFFGQQEETGPTLGLDLN